MPTPDIARNVPDAKLRLHNHQGRHHQQVYNVSAAGQKFLVTCPLKDASTRPLMAVPNSRGAAEAVAQSDQFS